MRRPKGSRDRRRIGAVLGVTLVLLVVPTALQAARPEPSRMVLQPADLPIGFVATRDRDRPNRAVATETGVSLERLRDWGRLGGHEMVYDRQVDPQRLPRGPASVTAVVSTYRSSAGLRKAFAASVARVARDRAVRHERRRPPDRLGSEARMWETRFGQDGVPVVIFTVLWRGRGVLSYLSVAGVRGRLTAADAVGLARAQDARIAVAARSTKPRLVAARLYTGSSLGR